MFCIGLISICYFQLPLFTGKVGYLIKNEVNIKDLAFILLGNILGASIIGITISYIRPELHILAHSIVKTKHNMNIITILINSILCGILMFIAVDIYKEKKSNIGILFAIPVFILSGFEHSIAYIFYAGVARDLNILILSIMVVGNSLGGFIIPLIKKYC